ncbi:hypothetical protein [Levilactobacillus acidifarinae]|uniref:Uncharacterized protein n=1 Tax=Levilactobacillus acidifarinae DSM 19394 = JCM 15949 TaxID=1423715 RepID=A0A0R1LT95_9LACO|nr:hypothetical protein [Levilactobacillus acidifarinae]KRK96041.1 hypothetical protein FD25_GL002502 [Levilactobacillus acidifarinae DSM 19394]GEO69684.1 hypothetical protein LAC03_15940 [Levilactobacillus acidifarinae]
MSRETKRQIAEQLFNDTSAYADIMALPHHVSTRHLAMLQGDRAAQFAPFAALTGYDDLLASSAQALRQQADLPFEALAKCRQNLRAVRAVIATKPRVELTAFDPETGECQTVRTRLRAVDDHQVTLLNGQVILVENLQAINRLPKGTTRD